uniref:Cytochrome P450 n=1 Tax=Scoparia dulcis TaxID=107240 RepID=A0A1W7HBW3_SCODU
MDISGLLLYTLLILCLHFFLKTFKPKNKRLPPGPKGLPILGSLLTIGDKPHESLTKLAKSYGPLMTVKFGFVNVVVASSKDMAKEILLKNDQTFLGRPTPVAVAAEKDYELSMVWSSGQGSHWKKLRKICNSQVFTTQRLDSLQNLRHQMMKNMIERVNEAREIGEEVYIGRLVFGTTLNLLSNTMFSGDMFDVNSDEMRELKELIANMMELAGKPNVVDYLPFLKPFDPQGIRRGMMVCYDGLHKLFDDIIGRRIKRRALESDRFGDFLDVLLDHTEEHGAEELNYQMVKIVLMDLFIGGTHSTTTTLEWALAQLLHNPPILFKAKQELSQVLATPKLVQEYDIPNLPYLDAVLKEAMRLHPTAPLLLPHRAEQDVEIQGYTIPKHTQVFVNAWSILRDPTYWDDPTSFKPERFLNSDIDFRGRDFSYIPFGSGRRICPGLNLGVRMVSVILANLVHNFDWKLPNGMKPEDMEMKDRFGITLQKDEPLVVIPM